VANLRRSFSFVRGHLVNLLALSLVSQHKSIEISSHHSPSLAEFLVPDVAKIRGLRGLYSREDSNLINCERARLDEQ